mgnify:CR=1 FL=1
MIRTLTRRPSASSNRLHKIGSEPPGARRNAAFRAAFWLPGDAFCAIATTFGEKVSSSRWRSAKAGAKDTGRFCRRIFYRKYGKNLLQIDNKRCIIYKWLWKPDTSSTDRDFLPVLRILCRRRCSMWRSSPPVRLRAGTEREEHEAASCCKIGRRHDKVQCFQAWNVRLRLPTMTN